MPENKDNQNPISVKCFASVRAAGPFDEQIVESFEDLYSLFVRWFRKAGDTDGVSKNEKDVLRKGVDLFNLGYYAPGTSNRQKRSLTGHSPVIVLDIDSINQAGLEVVQGVLAGVTYFQYPTQSCPEYESGKMLRVRILIHTDRPFIIDRSTNQYNLVVSSLIKILQAEIDADGSAEVLIDPASQRPNQLYYVPCGSLWKKEAITFSPGEPLDVASILESPLNEAAAPDGTTRDVSFRRLDHSPSFKKRCSKFESTYFQDLASRPKEFGTHMYDLKNDRVFTLAGMASSGGLSVDREDLLKKIIDAHTERLSGWGEEGLAETVSVIEKAFEDGWESPLYGSISDDSLRMTSYPESREYEADSGDDSDRKTIAELVGFDGSDSFADRYNRISRIIEDPQMAVDLLNKWLNIRYRDPDMCGKTHPLFRAPRAGKNCLYLFEDGKTYWEKVSVGMGAPERHRAVAVPAKVFLDEISDNIAQEIVNQAYKSYQEANLVLIEKAQEGPPESVFPAMKDALMELWEAATAKDLSSFKKEIHKLHKPLCIDYLANYVMENTSEDSVYRLPFNNGVLNLRTMDIEPGCPEDFFTHAVMCDYVPESECPMFDAFMDRCFPDFELSEYFQKLLGMGLVGGNAQQKIYFSIGKGANGKTTIQEIMNGLLGDFCRKVPNDTIKRKPGDTHPALQAEFAGLRIAHISELERNDNLDVPRMKALVGDAAFRARRLHADYETVRMEATIMVASNYMPVLADEDPAVWRRVEVIPWTQVIPKAEQDPQLVEKIIQAESEGIMAKLSKLANEYLKALDEDRTHTYLKPPQAVLEATDRERRACNRALAWLESAAAQRDFKAFYEDEVHNRLGALDALPPEFCCRIERLWEAYCKYTRNAATRLPAYESVERFILGMEQLGFMKMGSNIRGICEMDTYRVLTKNTDLN